MKALSDAHNGPASGVTESEPEIVACANAGFDGYVAPEASSTELLQALQAAVRGELYCSPTVSAFLFRHLRRSAAASASSSSRYPLLTDRQTQILGLVQE